MKQEVVDFLNEKADQYNQSFFIEDDPICIPHQFEKKEDIESIGFIVATIAWGNRKSIITNGKKLIDIMGNKPYDFIMNASESDLADLVFVHRTFNVDDLKFFIRSMRSLYSHHGGIEASFSKGKNAKERISHFRECFLASPHEKRSEKHVSNPMKGSSCKRINMYLRWMARKDKRGVDFGLWNSIPMSELYVPLDVHVGKVARQLGILKRKADDWKALEELMEVLRKLDPEDPCKYDFALFGIGVNNDLERLQ